MPISELKLEQKMPMPDHVYPLHKYTKEKYAESIKRVHNSVNNQQYPKKVDKELFKDRIQFTIIGNRFTKEYVQIVHVAKGLHKYRSKKFDAPIIKGVTGVEWPKVRNDLKTKYGGAVYCIRSPVMVLVNGKILGGIEEFNDFVNAKYYFHHKLDLPKLCADEFVNFVKSSGRPCAYMHISINKKHIGTLIFMLYADIVPLTCENFLRLCNVKKAGYSGTPVHRIVKDSWIQCGGYGLKSTELDCENFCVPHDRRGVLCMANDGRHIDCSTQFFVLLQPAPWMANKYVAFGQLIEGDETLKHIESVPTWYESPTKNIIIADSGVLNLDCQDIAINKGTIEYLESHVEDLIALGDWLFETILDQVFLMLELKDVDGSLEESKEEIDEKPLIGLHTTERFLRAKEDMPKEMHERKHEGKPHEHKAEEINELENNDFDVEEYSYEPEETYHHVSIADTPSVVVKPSKPYYLAFTDVPYPDEIDSTHDLKKFLKGHYCVESDLLPADFKKLQKPSMAARASYYSEIREDISTLRSVASLDSEDEKELTTYLKFNVDRVSFAGGVVRNIARGIGNASYYEGIRKSELMNEEDIRNLRQRLACVGNSKVDISRHSECGLEYRKVSIALPETEKEVHKIKRRQTGFMRQMDLEKYHYIPSNIDMVDDDDDSDDEDIEKGLGGERKVRIASSTAVGDNPEPPRRPTGFVRPKDTERQSVLARLYDDVAGSSSNDIGPTLKNYKRFSESHNKNMFLTISPMARIKCMTNEERFYRRPSLVEDSSFEDIMNMQHGKQFARKISSDYVTTIDLVERKVKNSLRSAEYAKTRPMLSVAEYQRRKMLNRAKSDQERDVELF